MLEVSVWLPPWQKVADVGLMVGAATVFTLSVAEFEFVVPQAFVQTARYLLLSSLDAAGKLYVGEVAPAMFDHVAPLSVETCHCTVAFVPSVEVNVAVLPGHTVRFAGEVGEGAEVVTVSVAAVVVAVPQLFVKTARYFLPLSAEPAVKLYVVEVAPLILVKVFPPSVETCHCTVGVGVPLAAAVNVAIVFWHTFLSVGFVVTAGAVLTVSVAAFVVAVFTELVKTARY